MTRLRAAVRRAGAPDRGTSLVELLVTIMVFAMLSTLLVGLVTTVSRSFSRDRAATDSARIAATAMTEITRVVRSGSPIGVRDQVLDDPVFLAAGGESVILRAFLDTDSAHPKPVVVHFAVTADRRLVESRWPANTASAPYWTFAGLPTAPYQLAPAYWTGAATTRTVAPTITPTAASGVTTFRYFDPDGVELVPDALAGLTPAQLSGVAAVTVTLSVQADPTGRALPVVLRNTVGLPNIGISRVGPVL